MNAAHLYFVLTLKKKTLFRLSLPCNLGGRRCHVGGRKEEGGSEGMDSWSFLRGEIGKEELFRETSCVG